MKVQTEPIHIRKLLLPLYHNLSVSWLEIYFFKKSMRVHKMVKHMLVILKGILQDF